MSKTKVMIVDDDYTSTSLLKTLLELDGFEVSVVIRGEKAMGEANRFVPDVFLVDYHLNDMSGIDLIITLRSTDLFSTTPIIMASGRDVGKEATAAGANLFLVKPYDPSKLAEQLNELIK